MACNKRMTVDLQKNMKLGETLKTSKSAGLGYLLDGMDGGSEREREVKDISGLCVGQPCWYPSLTENIKRTLTGG